MKHKYILLIAVLIVILLAFTACNSVSKGIVTAKSTKIPTKELFDGVKLRLFVVGEYFLLLNSEKWVLVDEQTYNSINIGDYYYGGQK